MRTIAAIAVVAAIAAAGWADAASPIHAEFTTRLLASRNLDIGPSGPGLGDALIRKYRLSDRDGHPVGFGYEDCRWMSARLLRCAATYRLPLGTIQVAGLIGDGSPLAITGGTGIYLATGGIATRNGRILRLLFTT